MIRAVAKKAFILSVLLCSCGLIPQVVGATQIENIELIGARRITLGTVLSYIPFEVGDRLTPELTQDIMRALYQTGFFKDVSLSRRDNVLVIRVKERPAIAEINIDGNKKVKTDDIEEAFTEVDLTRGRTYNDQVLDTMQKELERLYYSIGRYNVKINASVVPLPRNRVKIDIKIKEGLTAKIRNINIIGNNRFSDSKLLSELELGIPKWYAFFSSKDEYAKSKLAGDLESLRSFYLDRGFINFKFESTQVTISPNKKDIYITISITEGDQYKINLVDVAGSLVVPKSELLNIIEQYNPKGEYFSNSKSVKASDKINQLLGNEGYAFADTRMRPTVDDEKKTVDLTFFVDSGKRVYVRRIGFSGNEKTLDSVYRREMRQMEGAWYAGDLIERSRVRLQRLSYVQDVSVETPAVPGTDDQVDVIYTVEERLSGSFNVGAGFSGDDGVAFSLGVTQNNLFGSGNSVSLSLNTSDVIRNLSLNYTNPFYTPDGVSRSIELFLREIDTDETLLTQYVINSYGANLRYGIPVSEFSVLRLGIGANNTDIGLPNFGSVPIEVDEFLDNNGDEYNNVIGTAAYIHDTRNRSIFPDKGSRHVISLELAVPGSDLEYYKTNYRAEHYWSVTDRSTFLFKYNIAFGKGIGDLDELPFFEKFIAGGIRSLRGFEARSIGPRDTRLVTDENGDIVEVPGDPFGGDLLTIGSLEYIFPLLGESKSSRMSLFYDFGNVYDEIDDFDTNGFRSSAGITLRWLAPVGAMIFSYAAPIDEQPGDEIERFQFTIGGSF